MGLLASLLALFGCDAQRIAKLEEGVSTEADVRKQFGDPVDAVVAADGSRTLEYPRQPEGWTNYFITIGPDGKMSALRQVLAEPYFVMVKTGMERADVGKLLGRPAKKQSYALKKDEEIWEWRYQSGGTSNKVFSVTFDAAGKVIAAASADDPRDTLGGGPSSR